MCVCVWHICGVAALQACTSACGTAPSVRGQLVGRILRTGIVLPRRMQTVALPVPTVEGGGGDILCGSAIIGAD